MPLDVIKIKNVFLAALEIPRLEDRHTYVDEACGTDLELRDYVRGMLNAHERHLTPVPEGPTKADPNLNFKLTPKLQPGTIIDDRYKIIELIAEGGMGSVYRASRVSELKMEVALKVVKPGMGSEQVLARFNIERQALAMMKHENIARVMDAGTTPEGLPYFVMELVKGLSLTKFCDESKLPIKERLELFEQICSAVQHAHQKGIVHRDLKPSNILVGLFDDRPVPKVIDFGLAKALNQPLTEDSLHTRFGAFVGTWQYTAPEQAQLNNLDIDTRADIYSLGVILYELLTGNPPLEKARLTKAAQDEVLRIIREEEPPKPSTKIHSSDQLPSIAAMRHCEPLQLERMVRGELDWIVMKALEKDRNRRFATANELGADIRRYLCGEAVQAGPVSWTYRLQKALRKHRGKVIAASLLLATVLIGSIVSTVGWITATQERKRADSQTEIALAINNFLKELLSEADPSVQVKPDQAFISGVTVKKALDRAAEKVGVRFADQPLIEAAIRHTMGKTYLGLGDLPAARKQLEKAEQLRLKHGGESRPERLDSLFELGWLDLFDSQFDKAENRLQMAKSLREQVLGANHPDTLRSKYALGVLLSYQDKPQQAREVLEQVLALQKQVQGEFHVNTMATQLDLAGVLQGQGDLATAEKLMLEVLEKQRKTLGNKHPDTFATLNSLAMVYDDKKETAKAEALLKEALTSTEEVFGKRNPSYLCYQCNLAAVYYTQEKYQMAVEIYQTALPVLKQVSGPTSNNTLGSTNNYAAALMKLGKPEQAEQLLLETLSGCMQTLSPKHSKTRGVLEGLVALYQGMKNEAKAREYQKLLDQSN